MNLCLVRCPSPFLLDDKSFPPLGLLAVGTGLKMRGHRVLIYDGPLDSIPEGHDGYGFGPTAPEYPAALSAMMSLRERCSRARMVLGGPHATLNHDACQRDKWDCVVVGDGDLVVHDAFTEGYDLILTDDLPLDEYPIPDRSLIDLRSYQYRLNGLPATTLVTSRGCPFRCAFCCKNHGRVRFRSAEKVIEEIDHLYAVWGYRSLLFPEDIFILDRTRAEAVFRHLRTLGIVWRCLVRADVLVRYGKSFVRRMRDCGCVSVGMGIESGSQRILDNIHKGESIDTIKTAIRWLDGAGIRVKGFFVLGLPGENPETLVETERFIAEIPLEDFDCVMFRPYPGSPIYDHREQYDVEWTDVDLSQSFYKGRLGEYHGDLRTSQATTEQIVAAWDHINRTYKRWSDI